MSIHSCSYYCDRPECIKAQRDEFVKRMETDVNGQERREPPTDIAAYIDWILRGGRFDNSHRECIVKGCENHANQGVFVGDLCSPCHGFITTGEGVYSQAYRNTKREWVGLTDVEVGDTLIDLPILGNGYFLRIAKAIEAALKEKNT